MPTGYTDKITETMSLEEFAMTCARAFGATIMMRDDPLDAPIKQFAPSSWNAERLLEARNELAALDVLSDEEAASIAGKEYDKRQSELTKAIVEKGAIERRYRRMLAMVEAWTPPTSEHSGLKDFMRSQISDSIRFDCGFDYLNEAAAVPRLDGPQWKSERRATLLKDIAYHSKADREERDRTAERNKWVEQLRSSLKHPEPASVAGGGE